MTTYIETYIFGIAGVTEKRNFTSVNNAAGLLTTYGNINESKSKRDERRAERVNKEIDGGLNTVGTIKYYTTQTLLDADNIFSGTKLLTKEKVVHITGREFETNTTEVARQAARVAESGTYNPANDTYDSATLCKEKTRQDYRDRETADGELTPWDPDNAANANYRTYINFPGNVG